MMSIHAAPDAARLDPVAAPRLTRLKMIGYGLLGAVMGAILLGLVYTAYVDHERTTGMWNYINQAIAAQNKATAAGVAK